MVRELSPRYSFTAPLYYTTLASFLSRISLECLLTESRDIVLFWAELLESM